MGTDAIRNYLTLLQSVLGDITAGTEIQETEDGPVLLCTVQSPFNSEEEIGYRFEITPIGDGMIVIETMMILFTGIGADKTAGLNRLAAEINNRLSLGSLRIFDAEGSVTLMYSNGSVFDEELDAGTVTKLLGRNVGIMETAAVNAGDYIYRYLNGEDVEALIADIGSEEEE